MSREESREMMKALQGKKNRDGQPHELTEDEIEMISWQVRSRIFPSPCPRLSFVLCRFCSDCADNKLLVPECYLLIMCMFDDVLEMFCACLGAMP